LDTISAGPDWLRRDDVAEIAAEAIRYRDGKKYDLLAYCIMPNHVHMVVDVERFAESLVRRDSVSPYILTEIIGSLRKYTAARANRVLCRSGSFWQHESYDRVIRDGDELERTLAYVLQNPVKAGLCQRSKDWKWSYLKSGLGAV